MRHPKHLQECDTTMTGRHAGGHSTFWGAENLFLTHAGSEPMFMYSLSGLHILVPMTDPWQNCMIW